jgi:phosphatidylinositol alpha-1,6-mannosyltransferase
MKKTLLLTHEYYPFKGGIARYCYNLFKFFKPEDYLVVTDHPEVPAQDNILKLKLTGWWWTPTWLLAYFKLKKIIKQSKIKQIFTPNILPLGSLAYALRLPYLISLHGLDINLALQNKPWLTRLILLRAKKILVNSLSTKAALAKLNLPAEKVVLFYPTLDFKTDYREDKLKKLRQDLKIKDSQKILLTVARLVKRKGQDLVIEAVAKLKSEFDLKYLIVGQGEEADHLQQLIKDKNLEDRVFILPEISDEDLIYYYKLADLFVLPHRQSQTDVEGFGLVFLEATKAGLLIVAGQSGGLQDVFVDRQSVWLVKQDDLQQLAEALRYLLNNPQEADKLKKQAWLVAQKLFDAPSQSQKLKAILEL